MNKSIRTVVAGVLMSIGGVTMSEGVESASPAVEQAARKAAGMERIVFIGNSITRHGPKADIGWTDNFGMAASSLERDYVHLVVSKVAEATGTKPEFMIEGAAQFEREFKTMPVDGMIERCRNFRPDSVVLAIGENVPNLATDEDKAKFKAVVLSLISGIKGTNNPSPAIFIRSSFWPEKVRDSILSEISRETGGVFLDISALGRDETNFARSERKFLNDGVAAHPGDKGMQGIANAIWSAMAAKAGLSAVKPAVIIVGDSTVADYPAGDRMRGWGQLLSKCLNPDTKVVNLALCGRSTKTFIQEKHWDAAMKRCSTGDFVMIQFGHNDSHGKDKPESTDASTEYKDHLRRYVDDVRSKGGTPVLVTPMHRRLFDKQGIITQELKPYAEAMKEVASEKKAALIDLHSLSGEAMQQLGDAGCADLFASAEDRTHFAEKGALLMARLIAGELRKQTFDHPFPVSGVPETGR